MILANLKTYYEEGDTIEYKCKEGFRFENEAQAMCSARQWNYPQCIQCKYKTRFIELLKRFLPMSLKPVMGLNTGTMCSNTFIYLRLGHLSCLTHLDVNIRK